MRLRKALIAAGIALALVSWIVLHYAGMRVGVVVTLVNSLILVIAILVERSRYKPILDQVPEGDWTETGERFVDPTTGRLVRVLFSPASGERLYVRAQAGRRKTG